MRQESSEEQCFFFMLLLVEETRGPYKDHQVWDSPESNQKSMADMPRHTVFKSVQFEGSWKNRGRKVVPNFTSRIYERMSIAVKSGVRELDRERMRVCRKTSRTCSSQRRRYAIREVRRAVFIVIAIV